MIDEKESSSSDIEVKRNHSAMNHLSDDFMDK